MADKCNQTATSQCDATSRIKTVLRSSIHMNEQEMINNILTQYNDDANTKLLRDFNHVKYYHQVDEAEVKFDKIYDHLTDGNTKTCDLKQCKYIHVYYRDRSKITNKYFSSNDNNAKLTIELMSRIHVYFIHAYDIDRLTPKERDIIADTVQDYNNAILHEEKEAVNELLEDKRTELITMMMQKKQKALNISRNNNKYIQANREQQSPLDKNSVDFPKIYAILRSYDIPIEQESIEAAFGEYKMDKNALISDIIEAYYTKINESLPLSNKIVTMHLPD
eukprot:209808_1